MRRSATVFERSTADVIVRANLARAPGDSEIWERQDKRQGVMTDPRDYKLDLSSTNGANDARAGSRGGANGAPRPYLSVHFKCCNAYSRSIATSTATRYEGRCPRCAKTVTFGVGKNGTDQRTFVVT